MGNLEQKHHTEEKTNPQTVTSIHSVCNWTWEYLGETLNEEKYKVYSIECWMNDIFLFTPKYKNYLKSKLDFSRKVSIKNLLNEIWKIDEWRNSGNAPITHAPTMHFAEKTLNEEYMDAFLDYLEEKNIRVSSVCVSIERFLELLSSFEQEGIKRLREWAEECLISDDYDEFIEYCKNERCKSNHFISNKKFDKLKDGFDREKESLEKII